AFMRYGSRVLFVAFAGIRWTLLATDGTPAGTTPIFDFGFYGSYPSRFVPMNGKLLFNAIDSAHGEELWTTDGTTAGTRLLADIKNGSASSSPGDRIVYHGKMLFAADDGIDG